MLQKKIDNINFGLLSPDLVRKISTVRIVMPDTYDDDGYPIEGGLMDLRLGVIDPGLRCKTCGGRMTVCSGHFGSIELVRPVAHIGYIKMIFTLLKTTCRKCGRILVPSEKIAEYRELMLSEEETDEDQTLKVIERGKKAMKCPHCKENQDNIKLLKPTTFFEGDQRLFPSQIRERLERVPDKDLSLLGINVKVARPEWGVLTVLPVPPVTARPSITLETGERSEDDLTHKLVDVLRINQRLADNISAGAPQLIIEDLWDLLQYHVTTYFFNEVSGIPPARHRSGRPLKTLFQRLKGKEGRFRYNLSGKRVNFSARTVISPDSSLSISEVGVPFRIAKELTVPIYVTERNLKEIKKTIKRKEYPQVNYVIRPDGRRKKITDLNKAEIVEELTAGYIVEKQLVDGDVVLFNRQPSLHRMSMMAHRVKVLPGKTFRINDAVSQPYNADYDGDEMNLHVPQTEEAKMEADILMKVENHILSIRDGKPIVRASQDQVTGLYFLTLKDTKYNKETALWILGQAGIRKLPGGVDKKEYTGKEIFSIIIPKNITLSYENKMCMENKCSKERCPYEGFVRIKKGKLESGVIETASVQGKLLMEIFRQNGPAGARKFLDRATKLGLAAIMLHGFSISIGDYYVSDEIVTRGRRTLTSVENKVDELIVKYTKGKLERLPGKTRRETLEDMIMGVLSKSRDDCGKLAQEGLGKGNNAVVMSKMGRGSALNVTQMTACLGQTAVRGKRLLRGYKNKSLPLFEDGDISASARGFIRSSYREGLKPYEFFFNSMGGRDGLVDKGINTAKSGYMQRRLINALLDVSIKEDRTVKDSSGSIIQFLYGEDGVNPMRVWKDDVIPKGVLSGK